MLKVVSSYYEYAPLKTAYIIQASHALSFEFLNWCVTLRLVEPA